MASVHFFEYYCKCGKFLFNNGDIVFSSALFGRNYMFVLRPMHTMTHRMNIKLIRPNNAKCNFCNRNLGAFVYGTFDGKDTVKFCRHLIVKRKVNLDIYRLVDESSELMMDEYGYNFVAQKDVVIPIKRSRIQ